MQPKKSISARLKAARTKLGFSQDEAAKEWGFSKRTIQDWEQGRHAPTGLYIEKLEAILRKAGV